MVERGANVVNALFKQRQSIENLLRALIALPPVNQLNLQTKCSDRTQWYEELMQPILKNNALNPTRIAPPFNGFMSGH
ncbi:hypothetical protein BLA29_013530 [Euroglyphus maynei]|uniref:Uncharacterized protein n=1 Tax=Euroglyphus maynei TaxID=6958 RepID=A0A1Y3AUE6_EURMA|nr:hypothetical protein BLA29_013530 [Euroglyphus maynei]